MRVDVFVSSVPLSDAAAQRVRDATLLGRPIKILSADLVLFKMVFFRAKDLADVERLVRFLGSELDRSYVGRWLEEMVGPHDERVRTWSRFCEGA